MEEKETALEVLDSYFLLGSFALIKQSSFGFILLELLLRDVKVSTLHIRKQSKEALFLTSFLVPAGGSMTLLFPPGMRGAVAVFCPLNLSDSIQVALMHARRGLTFFFLFRILLLLGLNVSVLVPSTSPVRPL